MCVPVSSHLALDVLFRQLQIGLKITNIASNVKQACWNCEWSLIWVILVMPCWCDVCLHNFRSRAKIIKFALVFSWTLPITNRDALLEHWLLPNDWERKWNWRIDKTSSCAWSNRPLRFELLRRHLRFLYRIIRWAEKIIKKFWFQFANDDFKFSSQDVGDDRREQLQPQQFSCSLHACWQVGRWDCGTQWNSSKRKKLSVTNTSNNGQM